MQILPPCANHDVQTVPDNLPAPGGGRIALGACPGIGAAAARGAALDVDLAALRAWGAQGLVSLVEPFELTLLGVEGLGERAAAQGLQWWHLPVVDGAAPGRAFEDGWRRAGPELHALLDARGRIALHCHAGLGRSGAVAARLLVERDTPPEEAIRRVRRARPGAIENDEQLQWVRTCRAH